MRTKIKIRKEVKDFLTANASIMDTFGDDGKTERKRYYYMPWWFCLDEKDTEVLEVEILGFHELPDDLVKEIWHQRDEVIARPPKPEWMQSHPTSPKDANQHGPE